MGLRTVHQVGYFFEYGSLLRKKSSATNVAYTHSFVFYALHLVTVCLSLCMTFQQSYNWPSALMSYIFVSFLELVSDELISKLPPLHNFTTFQSELVYAIRNLPGQQALGDTMTLKSGVCNNEIEV